MKIQLSITGIRPRPELEWPEGWPVPRVGEEIEVKGGQTIFVRHVVYYPEGDFEEKEPFIYVVAGPRGYQGENPHA